MASQIGTPRVSKHVEHAGYFHWNGITKKQIKAKLKAMCPICATTRALVKIPRDPAKRHAQEPGWMLHVDVWGPYPIEGFDGTRYFLFITDDTWSARFDKKYQLFEVFKSLVKLIQKVRTGRFGQ